MGGVVFLRLHGGLVHVKSNDPKFMKGNELGTVKNAMVRGVEKDVAVYKIPTYPDGWDKKWHGCAPRIVTGRTNTLKQQLLKAIDVLEELHIDYYVGFGTLIGVLRDGGMNANEVDNDIVITRLSMSPNVYNVFHNHGLHVFLQDVWRVCFAGGGARRAAWDVSNYYPYTDIYDKSAMWRLFKINSDMKNRTNITVFNRNISVPSPRIRNRILMRYKNWRVPRIKEPHKRAINNRYT